MAVLIAVLTAAAIAYLALNGKRIVMRARVLKFTLAGVTFIDPGSVYIAKGAHIERGAVIHPNVYIYKGTVVRKRCVIYPEVHLFRADLGESCIIWPSVSMFDASLGMDVVVNKGSRIVRSTIYEDCRIESYSLIKDSRIERRCRVGPYSDINDSNLKGNVETAHAQIVRSRVGPGTKAKHESYIGDADIGANCNIAHDVTFCNYDGSKKHLTVIEDDVFIGSGVKLIAPLTIKKGSFIAAGSVVSKDVPPNTVVVDRGQVHKHHPDSGKGGGTTYKRGYVVKDGNKWLLGKARKRIKAANEKAGEDRSRLEGGCWTPRDLREENPEKNRTFRGPRRY